MAGWDAALCEGCWKKYNGDRTPYRLKQPNQEICYRCGESTRSGIYVRKDPAEQIFFTSEGLVE